GPLTGMMMIYELSGSPTIILSLMVTCAIASALCHQLIERKAPKQRSEDDVLRETEVRRLAADVSPVPSELQLRPLADLLIASQHGALPVLDGQGRIYGIVDVDALREVWREEQMHPLLVAKDLARPVPTLSAEQDLSAALELMDQQDVDAVPVVDKQRSASPYGILTRTAIRRFILREQRSQQDTRAPVASTEIPA
ncbi:MAG TPA: CBS domain-containing protein, partial [Myxococcaceae bacterium]|nr:CBS domain-containing protein [Myxococcaceae bacterium]